jgi:hypothetical protein
MDLKSIANQRLEKINREQGCEHFVNTGRKPVFKEVYFYSRLHERCEQNSGQPSLSDHPLNKAKNSFLNTKPLSVPGVKRRMEWDEPLAKWFLSEEKLPLEPFQFKPAVWLADLQKFYNSLKADVMLGRKSPRALFGALQDELRRLKAIVDERNQCLERASLHGFFRENI